MYRSIAAFAAAGLLLAGQAAVAAEGARISAVSGSVMISQNGRFVPASNGAVLRAGDRVVASSGSARVVYGDGCNVAVTARSMATVAAASPCVGGSSGVVKISTQSDDRDDRGAYGYGDNRDLYLWLGFGVLTGVVTYYALDDDSDPNSP
ncbi:MAG: hypothetical protein Q8J89_00765 [Caulobacter sp.]|nr:hypothetical protein [Caulobacter sp.]